MNEEMFQWMKEFTPKVWDLAVRQVWIDALSMALGFSFFLSALVLVLLRGKKKGFDEITFVFLAFLESSALSLHLSSFLRPCQGC